MKIETVEQIVALLSEYPVSEILVEQEGTRVLARRPLTVAPPPVTLMPSDATSEEASVPPQAARQEVMVEPVPLTAGMVGLFRHQDPPVGYGARIAEGQTIGCIEAMKVLNDVRAGASGRVVDVLVEEGAPVEYGQPLFRLMPEL